MGSGGETPIRQAIFVVFRKKKQQHFNAIWTSFCTFLEPFERTKLLKFGSHLKELNCLDPTAPLPPYLQVKFKTRLNACILGLIFYVALLLFYVP